MASLDSLSDAEIRDKLIELGYPVGPITPTTRVVLLKKLKYLLEQSKLPGSDKKCVKNRADLSRYRCEEEPSNTRSRKSMPPPAPPFKSPSQTVKSRSLGRQVQDDNNSFEDPTSVSDFVRRPPAASSHKSALETLRTQQALIEDALTALRNSLKSCPNEDTYVDNPQALQVNLMPHQKYDLAWLLWREKSEPSGGILASDNMDLGRTLLMISLIVKTSKENDEANANESYTETHWISKKHDTLVPGKTLVICPASLIDQWKNEFKNRVKMGKLDVYVHQGTQRETEARRLARHDVAITSYAIVLGEIKSKGPLFGIRWQRVIIDEAHEIKNSTTQTAQSIFQLKAKHRWALTSTPVHNRESDLYALIKFLRCSPFDDSTVWKQWFVNCDEAGIQIHNIILKSLMLRRNKQGLQEQGQRMCLKEKHFHNFVITLDKDEQSIYEKLFNFSATLFAQILHQKAEQSNTLPGMGVSMKNSNYLKNPFDNHPDLARLYKQMKEVSDIKYHHILVQILRLRQFCCHPALITAMFEKEEMVNDGIEDADGLDLDLMDLMTRLSLVPSDCKKQADDNSKKADWANLTTQNPLFAKDRLNSKMFEKEEMANDGIEDADGLNLDLMEKMTRLTLVPSDCKKQADDDSEKADWANLTTQNPLFAKDRLNSKMQKVVATLEDILKSDDKVVIVSEWVSLLQVIETVLKKRKIECVTIKGEIPVEKRKDIAEKFNRKNRSPRVMLLSLTIGVGLNLVGANHIIFLEPHWNPQKESQACDRICGAGQEKDVHVYKFVVSKSIEEYILNMQKNKMKMANDILTGPSQPTLDELMMLFQMKD